MSRLNIEPLSHEPIISRRTGQTFGIQSGYCARICCAPPEATGRCSRDSDHASQTKSECARRADTRLVSGEFESGMALTTSDAGRRASLPVEESS